jgi:hypothetical protein
MPPRIAFPILALAVSVFLLPAQSLRQKTVILGALEDQPGSGYEVPHLRDFRDVRVMFYKDGNEWRSFPSDAPGPQGTSAAPLPGEMTWIIGYRGKILGRVTGRVDHTGPFSFGALLDAEKIISAGPVPTVGKRSPIYDEADSKNTMVYRPLVANSQPYFQDKDNWRPVSVSPNLLGSLRQYFRQKYPHVENCRNPDENIERPWHYEDKNLTLTYAYRSSRLRKNRFGRLFSSSFGLIGGC